MNKEEKELEKIVVLQIKIEILRELEEIDGDFRNIEKIVDTYPGVDNWIVNYCYDKTGKELEVLLDSLEYEYITIMSKIKIENACKSALRDKKLNQLLDE